MPALEVTRSFQFALAPTELQREGFLKSAGACRWAYNYALEKKTRSHQAWVSRRDALLANGLTKEQWKAQMRDEAADLKASCAAWDHHRRALISMARAAGPKVSPLPQEPNELVAQLAREREEARPGGSGEEYARALSRARRMVARLKAELFVRGDQIPNQHDMAAIWRTERDLPKEEGGTPWWNEVNVFSFTSGFDRAQAAWNNWMNSARGQRGGRRVGYPRYKKKGRCLDSFTLYHDVQKPRIRLDGYRHLIIPTSGRVRIHGSSRRLARLIAGGEARVQSVTITRRAHRWYASVSCRIIQPSSAKQTVRQRVGGTVGVDLGSRYLAVLSHGPVRRSDVGNFIPHPEHLTRSLPRINRINRRLNRTQSGSRRARLLSAQLATEQHLVALRRAGTLHGITKTLAQSYSCIAIEDFDLVSLVSSVKGSRSRPGVKVKVKSYFNRRLLDASLGEFRRQLAYKCAQYGSQLITLDRGEPVATTCSRCGERNLNAKPFRERFTCSACSYTTCRHENAAACIFLAARRKISIVASGSGETENARRALVSPRIPRESRLTAMKREDTRVPPPASDHRVPIGQETRQPVLLPRPAGQPQQCAVNPAL
ncbi:RNA-guided endonuclease TnpB family protein [Streptomyces sp. NBC_01264]|uniref:RNA-guided endonuclease TnpB family protein n=1 Tax=Streptomyces sp. NBC_01264 TaxID=2903804 RepID=UPI002250BD74|nr:RNA-guided endonuclease TnpB family protein [Streptomyces sp. NBC_01264]MCX4784514.1 transposase [Streptomyces sp. NBC_01264]